jgi:4-amino-4-deoxy-L-arabinose transferase-like glycosyltransferase
LIPASESSPRVSPAETTRWFAGLYRARNAVVIVGLLTVVGLALRLSLYGDSLFGDELSTYYIVAGHSFGQVMHLLNNHSVELNPPLFFILTWVSQSLFGLSTESLRLVSLLAGTATIPLTFALGRMVGPRTGLVAAVLAATSPFLIYYSTEARAYALMASLVLAAALALLKALRSSGWGWWILYSVCTCAAAYTHYMSVFALIALALWALVTQPAARLRTAVALVGAAILYVPELPVLRETSKSSGTGIMGFLDPLSVHSVRVDLGHWAIGHPYVSLTQVPSTTALALIGAAVVGALAGAGQRLGPRLRQAELPRPKATEALVALLAVAAPVGAILYTLFRPSVWGARNVISSWPAFAVCLAALVSYPRAPWRLVTISLLLIGFTIGGVTMLSGSVHRPDYQDAVAYLNRVDPHGGPVVDLPGPTPGPPEEAEAALDLAGVAHQHPLFRIGTPTLRQVLAAPPYAALSAPTGETIAHEAAAAAGRGPLFLILPSSVSAARLQSVRQRHMHSTASPLAYLGSFLGALPARFRFVSTHTSAGLAPVTVYVLRG